MGRSSAASATGSLGGLERSRSSSSTRTPTKRNTPKPQTKRTVHNFLDLFGRRGGGSRGNKNKKRINSVTVSSDEGEPNHDGAVPSQQTRAPLPTSTTPAESAVAADPPYLDMTPPRGGESPKNGAKSFRRRRRRRQQTDSSSSEAAHDGPTSVASSSPASSPDRPPETTGRIHLFHRRRGGVPPPSPQRSLVPPTVTPDGGATTAAAAVEGSTATTTTPIAATPPRTTTAAATTPPPSGVKESSNVAVTPPPPPQQKPPKTPMSVTLAKASPRNVLRRKKPPPLPPTPPRPLVPEEQAPAVQAVLQQQILMSKMKKKSPMKKLLHIRTTEHPQEPQPPSPKLDAEAQEQINQAVVALDQAGNALFGQGKYDDAFLRYERALILKRRALDVAADPDAAGAVNPQEQPAAATAGEASATASVIGGSGIGTPKRKSYRLHKNKKSPQPQHKADDDENSMTHEKSVLASVATSINNMTYLKQRAGQLSDEETMASYLKSLQIKRDILGPNHLSVGKTLNNIGSVFYLKREYEPALAAYQDACAIMKNALGPDHVDVGTVISNMGDVYTATGQTDKALEQYRTALGVRWKCLGQQDPKTIRLMEQIAQLETGLRQPLRLDHSDSENEDFQDAEDYYYYSDDDGDNDDDEKDHDGSAEGREKRHYFEHLFMIDAKTLQEELQEDMKYFDLVERQMAIDMLKDKTRIFREMRELGTSTSSHGSSGAFDFSASSSSLLTGNHHPSASIMVAASGGQRHDCFALSGVFSQPGVFEEEDEEDLVEGLKGDNDNEDGMGQQQQAGGQPSGEEAAAATPSKDTKQPGSEDATKARLELTSHSDHTAPVASPRPVVSSSSPPYHYARRPSFQTEGSITTTATTAGAAPAGTTSRLTPQDRKKALVSVRDRLERLRASRQQQEQQQQQQQNGRGGRDSIVSPLAWTSPTTTTRTKAADTTAVTTGVAAAADTLPPRPVVTTTTNPATTTSTTTEAAVTDTTPTTTIYNGRTLTLI